MHLVVAVAAGDVVGWGPVGKALEVAGSAIVEDHTAYAVLCSNEQTKALMERLYQLRPY